MCEQLTSNAYNIPSNALELSENKFKIELIDVKCDKNEDGMHVTIQFAEPFDGIIYSQRFFNDPKCRYFGTKYLFFDIKPTIVKTNAELIQTFQIIL